MNKWLEHNIYPSDFKLLEFENWRESSNLYSKGNNKSTRIKSKLNLLLCTNVGMSQILWHSGRPILGLQEHAQKWESPIYKHSTYKEQTTRRCFVIATLSWDNTLKINLRTQKYPSSSVW